MDYVGAPVDGTDQARVVETSNSKGAYRIEQSLQMLIGATEKELEQQSIRETPFQKRVAVQSCTKNGEKIKPEN